MLLVVCVSLLTALITGATASSVITALPVVSLRLRDTHAHKLLHPPLHTRPHSLRLIPLHTPLPLPRHIRATMAATAATRALAVSVTRTLIVLAFSAAARTDGQTQLTELTLTADTLVPCLQQA